MNNSIQHKTGPNLFPLLILGLGIVFLWWCSHANLIAPRNFICLATVVEGIRKLISKGETHPKNNVAKRPWDKGRMRQTFTAGEMGFPAKVMGDIFHVGDGITAIVGDIEIPSKSIVNQTLVVKGTVKIGTGCRIIGSIKAMKDVTTGANTMVKGNIVSGGKVIIQKGTTVKGKIDARKGLSVAPGATLKSLVIADGDIKINMASRVLGNVTVKGGKVFVGPNCIIGGSIECSGDVKIDEKSVVKGSVHSSSSIILDKTARVCRVVNAEKGVYLRTCVK